MQAFILVCLTAGVLAYEHRITYVGFDHVLDFNPVSATARAFDFRRHLPLNDTCDFLVFPPLVEASPFIDVLSASIKDARAVDLTFLGSETFMVQDGTTGSYVIRRCSGFMPQQTVVPCEVYALGKSLDFLAPNRYFYAGPNKLLRYNRDTQTLAVLFYDSDVHGGGYPFGMGPIMSGSFTQLSGSVELAVTEIQELNVFFLVGVDTNSGTLMIWQYFPDAVTFDKLLSPSPVLTGTVAPGFSVKTLQENHLMMYNPVTGDFEVWAIRYNASLIIDVVKRDNLENGHGCIYHDRQTCISYNGCGWCADTATCHQLTAQRTMCDGTCQNIVDQYSPDSKKYQLKEHPIDIKIFGDVPPVDPVNPLRAIYSEASATPLLRNNDMEPEQYLEGININPAEGIVFLPPVALAQPCMDDEYVDVKTVPAPDMNAQETKMNVATGIAVPFGTHSPAGAPQGPGDCEGIEPLALAKMDVKNITATKIARLHNVFKIADEHHRNSLALDGLSKAFTMLGNDIPNYKIRLFMALADRNHDAVIDFPDFVEALGLIAPKGMFEKTLAAVDGDADGQVSEGEFMEALALMQAKMPAMQVRSLFDHVDFNKDGFVPYHEFLIGLHNLVYQETLADPIAVALAKSPAVTEGSGLVNLPTPNDPTVTDFTPLNDGVAYGEDTMNQVRSLYSSLVPKGDNIAVVRLDGSDPAVPDSPQALQTQIYQPNEPNHKAQPHTPTPERLILPDQPALLPASKMETAQVGPYVFAPPDGALLSAGNMETAGKTADDACHSPSNANNVQQKAMTWSQYISPSITQPSAISGEDTPLDATGRQNPVEEQLPARTDEGVVEGWKVSDVKSDIAQVVLKANQGVEMPPVLVDPADPAKPSDVALTPTETAVDVPVGIVTTPVVTDEVVHPVEPSPTIATLSDIEQAVALANKAALNALVPPGRR